MNKENEFDLEVQVWLKNGIVQDCAHPDRDCGCNQRFYQGMPIEEARRYMHRTLWGPPKESMNREAK